MNTLSVNNPFGAPVYFKETVTSTMDEARLLVNEPSGTVIAADEQSTGRGRAGRPWKTGKGKSLSFTVILHYGTIPAIPPCLTLKAGLAVSCAIEDFIEEFAAFVLGAQKPTPAGKVSLCGKILVKWPNDVMLPGRDGLGRKAAGILTEAEDGTVYIGIGVNIAQKSFPPELAVKACSIAQALPELPPWNNEGAASLAERRFTLLEMILSRLYKELETPDCVSDWRKRLEEKLYMKGQKVSFIPGLPEELAGKSSIIAGTLQGVEENGGICIVQDSGDVFSCMNGELKVYD